MRLAVIASTLVAALSTVVVQAQTISFDFDRSAAFDRYKTYAWVQGTPVPDPFIDQRVVNAVDARMAAKGLAKVDAGAHPDVLVAYHAAFERDLQVSGFGTGWGGYRYGGSRSGSARAEEILVGTLIVDVVDATTRTIVWRGTATKDVDVNAKPDQRDRNINKTADKLFKNYPPK